MNENIIVSNFASNSINDNLIKNTNSEIPTQTIDEKPIFVLKKKWYINDILLKLLCLFMMLVVWNMPSNVIADPSSNTLKIIGAYIVFYLPVMTFLFSLASDATRLISCYKDYIYINGLFFDLKLKYTDVKYYVYFTRYGLFAELLTFNYIGSKFGRLFFCNMFSSSQFRKKDLKEFIEILKSKGVEES